MIFSRFILTHSHSYSIRVIDHFKVKMAGYWPIFLSFFFFLCVLWTAANERDLYPLILTFNLTFQLNNITYMECGGHWVRINMLRVTPILIKKKNSKWGRFDCLANKRFIYCIAKRSRRLQWESRINLFFFWVLDITWQIGKKTADLISLHCWWVNVKNVD